MALREEVKAALDAEPPSARDRGAANLALTYATQIDDGGDLAKLGPALLASLEALLLSPRARAAVKAVSDDKPAANPLDQLAGRRARRGRTEDLDAPAS